MSEPKRRCESPPKKSRTPIATPAVDRSTPASINGDVPRSRYCQRPGSMLALLNPGPAPGDDNCGSTERPTSAPPRPPCPVGVRNAAGVAYGVPYQVIRKAPPLGQ